MNPQTEANPRTWGNNHKRGDGGNGPIGGGQRGTAHHGESTNHAIASGDLGFCEDDGGLSEKGHGQVSQASEVGFVGFTSSQVEHLFNLFKERQS